MKPQNDKFVLVRYQGRLYHKLRPWCRLITPNYFSIELTEVRKKIFRPCPLCYESEYQFPKWRFDILELIPARWTFLRRWWFDFAIVSTLDAMSNLRSKYIAIEKELIPNDIR